VAHEYAHGIAAYKQGDDTAYMLGRLTFNPIPHIDPWMSILFPAILWYTSHGQFTFGGAKPIPVNPRKYRNYKRGDIIVSSAGVLTNLGLSLVFTLVFALIGILGQSLPDMLPVMVTAQRMMFFGVQLNLMLCFFNLIPIPPLDGSHLFYYLLPPELGLRYRSLQRFGFILVLAILVLFRPVITFFLLPAFWLGAHLLGMVSPYALTVS
jgi:Zn-dependent protease